MNTVPCKGCGKPIVYAKITKADGTLGKIPLDPAAPTYFYDETDYTACRANGKDFDAHPALVSHFATCPERDKFSSSKGKSKQAEAPLARPAWRSVSKADELTHWSEDPNKTLCYKPTVNVRHGETPPDLDRRRKILDSGHEHRCKKCEELLETGVRLT